LEKGNGKGKEKTMAALFEFGAGPAENRDPGFDGGEKSQAETGGKGAGESKIEQKKGTLSKSLTPVKKRRGGDSATVREWGGPPRSQEKASLLGGGRGPQNKKVAVDWVGGGGPNGGFA